MADKTYLSEYEKDASLNLLSVDEQILHSVLLQFNKIKKLLVVKGSAGTVHDYDEKEYEVSPGVLWFRLSKDMWARAQQLVDMLLDTHGIKFANFRYTKWNNNIVSYLEIVFSGYGENAEIEKTLNGIVQYFQLVEQHTKESN